MSDKVVIGKFGRPHGVQGEVRYFPYNPDSDLIVADLELFVSSGSYVVSSVRSADKFLIVSLDGVRGREAAAALRNEEVWVPRDVLPDLDDEEFYLADVVGFEVWAPATEGAELHLVGRLKDWLDVAATDIMAVTGPNIRGRMLVPYIDHVVEEIDFDAERVVLHPLDTWTPDEDR